MLQGLPVPSLHDTAEAIGFVALAFKSVFDHRKGAKRDTASGSALKRLETGLNDLTDDVRDVRIDVVKIQAKLDNGLSEDIRELKSDVKGITNREIDRARDPIHAPYRPIV